jgi:hypothetical protein
MAATDELSKQVHRPTDDAAGLLPELIGDGRPLLALVALGLILDLHQCGVVHLIFHDRVSFGGTLLAIGTLYLWLIAFPRSRRLRRRDRLLRPHRDPDDVEGAAYASHVAGTAGGRNHRIRLRHRRAFLDALPRHLPPDSSRERRSHLCRGSSMPAPRRP